MNKKKKHILSKKEIGTKRKYQKMKLKHQSEKS